MILCCDQHMKIKLLNTVVTQEMPIIISYPGLVQMLPDNKKISTFIL